MRFKQVIWSPTFPKPSVHPAHDSHEFHRLGLGRPNPPTIAHESRLDLLRLRLHRGFRRGNDRKSRQLRILLTSGLVHPGAVERPGFHRRRQRVAVLPHASRHILQHQSELYQSAACPARPQTS